MEEKLCEKFIVRNERNEKVLASDASFALSRRNRMRGLTGRDSIGDCEALIFKGCRQIHTFRMRFSIDVIFANKKGIVVKAIRNLEPGRISPIVLRAYYAIEFPAGKIDETETALGDRVIFLRAGSV